MIWRKKSEIRPAFVGGAAQGMKRKVAWCAAEAAVVSVGIHLILLSFAGSMVVMNFVREKAAAFKGEHVERPVLEKRAVPLPVEIRDMQKKGPQPKVSGRIVSAAALPFTLPVMDLPEVSFGSAGSSTDSLNLSSRSMPGGLDFGVTGVNFFGTRSSGEKMVFILDASRQMMEDAKGGYFTYRFAKDKIHQMVDAMPSATLFNVMVYNDQNVDMFRPQPVPATQANRDALKVWLEPVNRDPHNVGQVSAGYRPSTVYRSAISGSVRHWLKAVQAAMEQTADNIFVLCAGYGRYSVSGPRPAVERDEQRMAEYRAKLDALNDRARKMLEAENQAREAKGLPPKIVYDWNSYVTEELRLVFPDAPPATLAGSAPADRQPEELVIEHMDMVWSTHYTPQELMPPRVHFVYLIAQDSSLHTGYLDIMALKKTAQFFRGDFEFLRGAKTMQNLLIGNRTL